MHTEQYTHNGKKHSPWWKFWDLDRIADQKQEGVSPGSDWNKRNGDNNTYVESQTQTQHSIFTFFNNIQNMEEGTYRLINGQWIKQ